jgi:hypothetical protein
VVRVFAVVRVDGHGDLLEQDGDLRWVRHEGF